MPYHLAENPPAYSAEQPRDNLPQISQILHNQQTQSFVRNTPCKETHSHAEQLHGSMPREWQKAFLPQQRIHKKRCAGNCIHQYASCAFALLNLNRP
jgi:hypothetical protein